LPTGQIKKGNKRLQLSITKEASDLLRLHALNYGEKSMIVNDLIMQKYGKPVQTCTPNTSG
jgi:hypothetical protein